MVPSLATSAILFAASRQAQGEQPLPQPVRETYNCSTDGSLWPYLLQVPSAEPAALLVYLHGHYGDEYQGMTEGTYNDAFGRLRHECVRRRWAYVSTYYGGNTWMGPLAESGVADLIATLRARWPGKPIYLLGGSMGGSSALVFAVRRPELLDGVVALCPAGDMEAYYSFASASADPTLRNIAAAIRIHYTSDGHLLDEELRLRSALLNAERLRMPVYLSHGAEDAVIPVGPVRALAARLRELGRPVRYVELPEGGHDAPLLQANWPDALDFVSQRAPRP